MRGCHLVKHWSLTQTTVALSSAEAELGGICKGTSISMGLRSVARDLGLEWKIVVLTDATAAIGVCKRRGLGKIRHLSAADLWIQERLRAGEFKLDKVLGSQSPSGCVSKCLDRPTLQRLVP